MPPTQQRGGQQDSGSPRSMHLPRVGSLLSDTRTALSLRTFPPLGAKLDLSHSH